MVSKGRRKTNEVRNVKESLVVVSIILVVLCHGVSETRPKPRRINLQIVPQDDGTKIYAFLFTSQG